MKNLKKSSAAFTLVEMLVVITIISIVALTMSRAVRGARRQAHAAKCQSNLKNLHTAVSGFLSDKQHYPLASSYETVDRHYTSGGDKNEAFVEKRGWVSWLPKDGKPRRDKDRKTIWQREGDKSHAADFYYPANTDERMPEAIREGALFKYTGKDLVAYRCPEHRTHMGKSVHLAYSLNGWFGSHSQRFAHDISGLWSAHTAKKNSSRMVLFIEIDEDGPSTEGENPSKSDRLGQSADEKTKKRVFADDCVWQWDHEERSKREKGKFPHRKAGKNYGHVVFLDGHVASICEKFDVFREESSSAPKANDMIDVFTAMGDGTF